MRESAVCLGAQSKVDPPLLVPNHLQGARRNFRDQSQNMGAAEGSKTGLSGQLALIRVARGPLGTPRKKEEGSSEVRLVQGVLVDESRQITRRRDPPGILFVVVGPRLVRLWVGVPVHALSGVLGREPVRELGEVVVPGFVGEISS